MRFDSLDALLYMDGHGVYVWATYLVTFIIFAGLAIYPLFQKRILLKKIIRQNRSAVMRTKLQSTLQEST